MEGSTAFIRPKRYPNLNILYFTKKILVHKGSNEMCSPELLLFKWLNLKSQNIVQGNTIGPVLFFQFINIISKVQLFIVE